LPEVEMNFFVDESIATNLRLSEFSLMDEFLLMSELASMEVSCPLMKGFVLGLMLNVSWW
jgi:hypothetical protein